MCDRDSGLTDTSSFLAEMSESAVTEPHANAANSSASRMTVLEIEVIPADVRLPNYLHSNEI